MADPFVVQLQGTLDKAGQPRSTWRTGCYYLIAHGEKVQVALKRPSQTPSSLGRHVNERGRNVTFEIQRRRHPRRADMKRWLASAWAPEGHRAPAESFSSAAPVARGFNSGVVD